MILSGYGATTGNYLKQHAMATFNNTSNLVNTAGSMLSKNLFASSNSASLVPSTYQNSPITGSGHIPGGQMASSIFPGEYGNGSLPAMMNGSVLHDSVTNGQSWNPGNKSSCDCAPMSIMDNGIFSSSTKYSSESTLNPTPSSSAIDQNDFYANMNEPSTYSSLGSSNNYNSYGSSSSPSYGSSSSPSYGSSSSPSYGSSSYDSSMVNSGGMY
jgi:hypothetical protein